MTFRSFSHDIWRRRKIWTEFLKFLWLYRWFWLQYRIKNGLNIKHCSLGDTAMLFLLCGCWWRWWGALTCKLPLSWADSLDQRYSSWTSWWDDLDPCSWMSCRQGDLIRCSRVDRFKNRGHLPTLIRDWCDVPVRSILSFRKYHSLSIFFNVRIKNRKRKGDDSLFFGISTIFSAGGKNFGRSWTSAGFCGKLARWNKFLLLCSTYQKCLNSCTSSSGDFLFVQKNWRSLTVLNCTLPAISFWRGPSPFQCLIQQKCSFSLLLYVAFCTFFSQCEIVIIS